jgi:hypothetical protein
VPAGARPGRLLQRRLLIGLGLELGLLLEVG